jgi:hypothetical protein
MLTCPPTSRTYVISMSPPTRLYETQQETSFAHSLYLAWLALTPTSALSAFHCDHLSLTSRECSLFTTQPTSAASAVTLPCGVVCLATVPIPFVRYKGGCQRHPFRTPLPRSECRLECIYSVQTKHASQPPFHTTRPQISHSQPHFHTALPQIDTAHQD